jgi:hypothetical protein
VTSEPDRDRPLERLLRDAMSDPLEQSTPQCVDAERLAAWSDGALSRAEREDIEAHMAACVRCQAMLAAFAQAAPPARAVVPLWRRSPARWLVPAMAGAAAVVIWLVLPPRGPVPATMPTQTARLEPHAVPDSRTSEAPRATADTVPPRDAAASRPVSPAPTHAREQASKNAPSTVAPAVPMPPPAAETAGRSGFSPPVSPSAMTAGAPAAGSVAADSAASAPAAGMDRRSTLATPSRAPVEIRSPESTHRWRLRGDVVEHSSTGGVSWEVAMKPEGVTVTGGMSPGPFVCWLIGRAGAVLLTTDGVRFHSVSVPDATDIATVFAQDAQRATVTTADGQTFTTLNGGGSWSRQ